jgi:hypothetical protein
MLTWIKNLLGTGEPKFSSVAKYDFSPIGKHSYTAAGEEIIPRPVDVKDPVADAFESRLLKWLQYTLKVKPESHFGTNALFWKFDFNGSPVELAVVGQTKNTGANISDELDWLLRVEEHEPLPFITALEAQFDDSRRVKRKLKHNGKMRYQFKSTELLKDSPLNSQKKA